MARAKKSKNRVSVWNWLLTLLLMAIPGVNLLAVIGAAEAQLRAGGADLDDRDRGWNRGRSDAYTGAGVEFRQYAAQSAGCAAHDCADDRACGVRRKSAS